MVKFFRFLVCLFIIVAAGKTICLKYDIVLLPLLAYYLKMKLGFSHLVIFMNLTKASVAN